MAKDPKQEQASPPIPDENAEPLGPPKSYRLYIVLGFVCIMLFQMILLYLILPSRTAVETAVGINPVEAVASFGDGSLVPPGIGKKPPTVETPIPVDATVTTIKVTRDDSTETFATKITVQTLVSDKKKFDARYAECSAEIIDRITTILQGSTTENFQEAGHTVIKEKMKKGINEVLRVAWVQDVFLPGASFDRQ